MSKRVEREETKVGHVYLHLSNSGVTVKVSDYYGPTVTVSASTFGNMQQEFKFATTKEGLKELRDLFDEALKHEFSEAYCHAVKPDRKTGSTEGESVCCANS